MKVVLYSIIVICILLGLSASFWFGKFSATFESNVCYSETIYEISKKLKNETELENWSKVKILSQELSLLPLHGYESSCEEIKLKVKNL